MNNFSKVGISQGKARRIWSDVQKNVCVHCFLSLIVSCCRMHGAGVKVMHKEGIQGSQESPFQRSEVRGHGRNRHNSEHFPPPFLKISSCVIKFSVETSVYNTQYCYQ